MAWISPGRFPVCKPSQTMTNKFPLKSYDLPLGTGVKGFRYAEKANDRFFRCGKNPYCQKIVIIYNGSSVYGFLNAAQASNTGSEQGTGLKQEAVHNVDLSGRGTFASERAPCRGLESSPLEATRPDGRCRRSFSRRLSKPPERRVRSGVDYGAFHAPLSRERPSGRVASNVVAGCTSRERVFRQVRTELCNENNRL